MPAIGAREVDRVPIGHRVYALEDNGNIRRIGGRHFTQLYDGRTDKPIPEYAGKRIRIAMVFVETRARKPIGICRVDYSLIGFDSQGFVDQKERWEAKKLVGDLWDPLIGGPADILDELRPGIAKLKYADRFRWTPTPEEKTRIEDLALKLW